MSDREVRTDREGRRWQYDASDGKWYRLILSYKRDENGTMTDLWSDDPWATARVRDAERNAR